MYKYKESKGIKRRGGALWWAVVILALGELLLLIMLLNQNRSFHAAINTVSNQMTQIEQTDPVANFDQQFTHLNRSINGALEILGSMDLNNAQLEKLNKIWKKPSLESEKPAPVTN